MLVRSNKMGWKFIRVKKVDKALETEAVKALKSIGLDFGAVDACVDVNGKPWIIEVNTGPGLEETPFNAWVETFKAEINAVLNPKSIGRKIVDKVTGRTTAPTMAKAGTVKSDLAKKLEMAQQMVAAADEEEAAVLDKVFGKMFG